MLHGLKKKLYLYHPLFCSDETQLLKCLIL